MNDYIIVTDGVPVNISDEILGALHNNKCSNFSGKPKVIILNACRGNINQEGKVLIHISCFVVYYWSILLDKLK